MSQLLGVENPLSALITKSRRLTEFYPLFNSPEEINYYSQFPEIQQAYSLIETSISNLIKDIGAFVGLDMPPKGNVKLSTATEIVEQYVDNIEIKIRKFQEEEQRIRIKQKNPEEK